MYARITTAYLRKELIDKTIQIVQESISPAARKQEGFRSLLTLIDRESGKGMFISVWESKKNVEANEKNQYYQEQLLKLMVTFSADPIKEGFEVIDMDKELQIPQT